MNFYVGTDDTKRAHELSHSMFSANRIARHSVMGHPLFRPNTWMLDSGAFTQITTHGDFTLSVEKYAKLIKRFSNRGNLTCAVSQDYMCEPVVREITGKSVREHQRMSTRRYFQLLKELRKISCDVELMPVLQGWEPEDYIDHLDMYEEVWAHRERISGYLYYFDDKWSAPEKPKYIGLGPMCKRNKNPGEVEHILDILLPRLIDYKVHLFGIKKTALKFAAIRGRIHSADSFAYDFHDRYTQKIRTRRERMESAKRFAKEIASQSVQMSLLFE